MLNLYEAVVYYSDGEEDYPVDYHIVRDASSEAVDALLRKSDERIDIRMIGWATGESDAGILRH